MSLPSVDELSHWLALHERVRAGALIVGVALLALLSLYVARRVVVRGIEKLLERTDAKWDDAFIRRGVFDKLAWLAPALVIYYSTYFFVSKAEPLIFRLLAAYTITLFLFVTGGLLSALTDIWSTTGLARDVPIKGYVQVVKIALYVTGIPVVIAVLLDRSPWAFLSGIGAATAILVLVFRDTLLSFVASLQIASNDIVRLGDWIEMPKYDANGEVVDIALHTVKVKNWDLTITTIPTFKLIEDSFKNWRGMSQSGARRIKRAVYLDVASLAFLDEERAARLEKIQLLTSYVRAKKDELARYNSENGIDTSVEVNGRRMTNIGTLRAYLQRYLESHPALRKDMPIIVRQLEPGPQGVALEIIAFTPETASATYEALVADLFDHILAAIPEFGLRVFQQPSTWDARR